MADNKRVFGTSDVPWHPDPSSLTEVNAGNLGLDKYARALASFIAHCETPMTIAIQGEWGSGKTSLMNMVESFLRAEDERLASKDRQPWLIHRFETWPYGVAGSDLFLGFKLLESIVMAIQTGVNKDTRPAAYNWVAERAAAAGKIAMRAAVGPMGRAVGAGVLGTQLQGYADGQWTVDAVSSAAPSTSTDLGKLRELFEKIVAKLVEAEQKKKGAGDSRVIIFIDDLDRVRPGNAVALLEVLKNFMDVKHCVFVVACDYEVVRLGVKEKLGITERSKVDQFFHKIFQVPFKMPVQHYTINQLLQDYLRKKAAGSRDYSEPSRHLQSLVTRAIGTNPRAFKRFVNTVDLLWCVAPGPTASTGSPGPVVNEGLVAPAAWANDMTNNTLLAVVALQARWPGVAAKLSMAHKEPDRIRGFFEAMRKMPDETGGSREDADSRISEFVEQDEQFQESDGKPSDWRLHPDFIALEGFVGDLWSMLDTNTNHKLDDAELAELSGWLENLALTGVGHPDVKESGWDLLCKSLAGERDGQALIRLASKLKDDKSSWKALRPLSSAGSLSFNAVHSDGGKLKWFSVLSITRAGALFVTRSGGEGAFRLLSQDLASAADTLRDCTAWIQWSELSNSGRMTASVLHGADVDRTFQAVRSYLLTVNRAWERSLLSLASKTGTPDGMTAEMGTQEVDLSPAEDSSVGEADSVRATTMRRS